MKGFDLETAIKMFLHFKEWGHSEDLNSFLEFVKKEGLRIIEPGYNHHSWKNA